MPTDEAEAQMLGSADLDDMKSEWTLQGVPPFRAWPFLQCLSGRESLISLSHLCQAASLCVTCECALSHLLHKAAVFLVDSSRGVLLRPPCSVNSAVTDLPGG